MKLVVYLTETGLTQAAFAQIAGVSETVISREVTRQREPGRNTAMRIIEATGGKVTFGDLWPQGGSEAAA